MRVRKHVNYKDDYDDDFFDDTISDKSILNRKRKKDISESGIDSYDIDNRSNKKKKFGSDTNSMRQSSQVDLSNYGFPHAQLPINNFHYNFLLYL